MSLQRVSKRTHMKKPRFRHGVWTGTKAADDFDERKRRGAETSGRIMN